MGNGIAHVFAQYGYQVVIYDIAATQLEKALATIKQNLERQAKKGAIPESLIAETMGRITRHPDMADLAQVDFAVEAVTENEPLKLDIFRKLDETVKDGAILASNTSSITDHQNRSGDQAAGQGDRHAFHESGAAHEAGRGNPWPRHQR